MNWTTIKIRVEASSNCAVALSWWDHKTLHNDCPKQRVTEGWNRVGL